MENTQSGDALNNFLANITKGAKKGDKKDEETSQSEGNNDSDAATSRQGTQYSTQHSRRQFSLGNESQVEDPGCRTPLEGKATRTSRTASAKRSRRWSARAPRSAMAQADVVRRMMFLQQAADMAPWQEAEDSDPDADLDRNTLSRSTLEQVQEYYESSESEEEDTTISIVERAQSRLTPVQVTPNHPKPTRRRASLPLARTQPPYIAKGRRARLM
eukprot:CAMPEP_0114319642 /NCGR_PEP_ID=MMETSP0059-20121206/25372_1 /TAXON_ID=36894 /ORGANISM="Pyramimonas parkeae, Strain CCMP726" /LENGTH=215 /DNA_ID=CAMNT_0001446707 /DNA_START=120 /DNA_END=767 /DNA_ORIENTATION=+